ncbi:Dehydrogenase/reductase SDR family protein 7-like [Armadillidium nasatum]|uniref:Dehydrogenase/reductase SDR family protein 7-like n=1 Tax=Armadillidium nasatum TaxID=96803 RepID=A0A5N5SJ01_9CRUS|nr:Dehydrogenase/reductase SDR family protein 7-like [Armadillidium nasatum]
MIQDSSEINNGKSTSVVLSLPWLLGWASLTVMGPLVMAKVIYKTVQVIMSHLLDKERELYGKIVLLTGASSGLGKELAHSLYRRGCRLILASRNTDALEELKRNLIYQYNPPELHIPTVVRLDLEDLNSIPSFVESILKSHGHIDMLINNAGISYRGEIVTTEVSVDVKLMVVNYLAQVALTKAIVKSMIKRKSGHIVGVSSIQGKLAMPFRSCYSASKHALQSFFDCLRAEVDHHNIYVTVVSPGYIKTNLSMNAITGNGDVHGVMDKTTASGMLPKVVAEKIVKAIVNKDTEVLICPFLHKLIVCIRLCAPSLYFYIMKIRSWNTRKKELKEKQC